MNIVFHTILFVLTPDFGTMVFLSIFSILLGLLCICFGRVIQVILGLSINDTANDVAL